jgi:hypothetical protein
MGLECHLAMVYEYYLAMAYQINVYVDFNRMAHVNDGL